MIKLGKQKFVERNLMHIMQHGYDILKKKRKLIKMNLIFKSKCTTEKRKRN
jgi:hypothetical protein